MTDHEALLKAGQQMIGDMMREVWRAGEAVKFYLPEDNYAALDFPDLYHSCCLGYLNQPRKPEVPRGLGGSLDREASNEFLRDACGAQGVCGLQGEEGSSSPHGL